MDSSTAGLLFQSCICPCMHSGSEYLGKADYAKQRTDSNCFAGSRYEVRSSLKSSISRKRPTEATRCRYSPLVESFDAPKDRTVTKLGSSNGSRIRMSPSSLSAMRPAEGEAVLEEDVRHRENSHTYVSDVEAGELEREVDNAVAPAPRDPVAAPEDDSALLAKASDAGHDLETRRIARYREPQMMSLTQTFRTVAHKGVNATVGAAGKGAMTKASKIGGPAGLLVGLAVAGLGIATALHKANDSQPQKLCSRCDGYGVECCGVCSGAGQIAWEGKAHRKNLCPRCFGSCLTKCPRCNGARVKKESIPVLQQMKTPSNASSSTSSKASSSTSSKTSSKSPPKSPSQKGPSKTLPKKT